MLIRILFLCSLLVFGYFLGPAEAARIHLRNGDKISGTITAQDHDFITLETEAMGTVTLSREYIDRVEGGPSRTAAAQTPRTETSRITWDNELALGYSKTGGNTRNSAGDASLRLNRKTKSDEWTAKVESHYGSSNGRMNEQKFRGLARYAYSYGKNLKWYHFIKLEGDRDRFADIDYRLIPSTGVGYWFSDTDDYKFMLEAALGWGYTRFRTGERTESNVVLMPRAFLKRALVGQLIFTENLILYPSLEDMEDYRLYSETSLNHPISNELSWRVSFVDEFSSMPSGSAKKNDYRIISSLVYSF